MSKTKNDQKDRWEETQRRLRALELRIALLESKVLREEEIGDNDSTTDDSDI